MPKKIRVYELAKELGLTNKEGLELALSLGIGVKSHSSSIEDAQADRVRRKAQAEFGYGLAGRLGLLRRSAHVVLRAVHAFVIFQRFQMGNDFGEKI